jgi:TrmH family RNA methyltransferase
MFSLRKLERLAPRTRLRKLLVMIRDEEQRLLDGAPMRPGDLLPLLRSEAFLSALEPSRRRDAELCLPALAGAGAGAEVLRCLNSLRHTIMSELGVPWAEWDLLLPGAAPRAVTERRVLPMRVYLEDVRSPYNVGAMFRTAEAFGVEHVYLSPRTPLPTLARARRSSRGSADMVAWSICTLSDLASRQGDSPGPVVFALETGGRPIEQFTFPPSGIVLVGSEELGLSPEALALAESGAGRVSIPMAGIRSSLNVAVAFGILMQAWHSRLER